MRGRRGCDRAAVLLRSFIEFDPVRSYIDALVHPSVRGDALASARHRTFIGVRLLAGLIVFAAIPIYLATAGAPGLLEAALFAGLISPLVIVWYLSRTGNLERAHLISTALLGALIALIAGASGGVASFAAPWLAVLPLEAALSASRRVILASIAVALAITFGLWGTAALEWIPQPSMPASPSTHFLALLSAALYVGAIALGMGAFTRSGERVKRAGEARYHLLARHMSDVITRHGRNGVVTFISPAAERLVGAPAAALMGHNLFERVHVADRPNFLAALIEASRGHTTSVEYRLRHGPLNGMGKEAREAFIWVESRCHALDGAPESGEVVAVTRDVSRRKLDAEALEAARREAERANDAKSRFLATVSHELRTPLNAIIGFSEMLTNDTPSGLDAERRADYARVIRDSGQHLLAVVNGILDVSRIEAGHFELNPEAFAVGPLVESCYEMMLLRAEQAGLRFDVELARDLPEAVADQLAVAPGADQPACQRDQVHPARRKCKPRGQDGRLRAAVERLRHRHRHRRIRSRPGRRAVLPGAFVLRSPVRGDRSRPLRRQGSSRDARRQARDHEPRRRGHARARAPAARMQRCVRSPESNGAIEPARCRARIRKGEASCVSVSWTGDRKSTFRGARRGRCAHRAGKIRRAFAACSAGSGRTGPPT